MTTWEEHQQLIRGRHRTRKRKGITKSAFQLRKFIPCDGEGVTTDGRHEYVLLRIGDAELFDSAGGGLSSTDCLDFIARQDPDRIYVGYFFDYDVTKILQGLPVERLERIVRRELRPNKYRPGACLPVDWGPYQIDYMKGKEFRVRKNSGPWIVISDVGPFFQCSFVKALTAWFPEDQWTAVIAKIKEGKDQRSSFGGLDQYMREYCELECNMLTRLMDKFRSTCYDLKLFPKEWQGPGRLAAAVLARERYPRSKDLPLWQSEQGWDIALLANSAYYGGRFEAAMFGDIPGPIYQYDINSAYPSVYRTLPCLQHGEWIEFTGSLPCDGSLYLADIQFEHRYAVQFCGLPVRTSRGTLLFPLAGRGVYWSHEIDATLPYLTHHTVFRGYKYIPKCKCDPFKWVEPMYLERKKLGKSGKGIVLKLALNSIYGKLCQSVGHPTFANPIHASLITSHTRSDLYRAMMMEGHGSDVIMAATDGIFTLKPRALDCGVRLGEWEETVHSKIFVVQSGVYYIDGQIPKTRGTPVTRLIAHESDFREAWEEYLPAVRTWKTQKDQFVRTVDIPVTNFISLALALAWNKPELAGQWLDDKRSIAFEWFSKRTLFSGNHITPGGAGSYLVTRPQEGDPLGQSIAYKKAIGGVLDRIRNDDREEERWLQETQPDWNQMT